MKERDGRVGTGPGPARFDRWAGTYDSSALQSTLFAPAQEAVLRRAARHALQARLVLDVGCGTGGLLRKARHVFGDAALVGVDLSHQMIAAGSGMVVGPPVVEFVRAAAEELPFAAGVFDVVFATMSYRHWADRAAGIAEVSRVLTAGGIVAVADVFPTCPRRRLTIVRRRRADRTASAVLGDLLAAHHLVVEARAFAGGCGMFCDTFTVIARKH